MKELQTVLNNILADKNTNLKPENLKKGITCLGVTGTLEASTSSGGVKQFSTVEEMNASTGNTEGDLAIVYRSEVQNATVDSKFQVATFPDTVVLDSAITDYVEVRYTAVDSSIVFDCWGNLTSSSFRMNCYSDSGEVRIQYTSSDGITYTRTDTTGNPVDFGTKIYYENSETWNDAIGKFIQTGGMYFDGLYDFRNYLDKDYFRFIPISNIDFASGTPVWNGIYTSEKYSVADVQAVVRQMKNDGVISKIYGLHSFIDSDNDLIISENLPNRYIINSSGNLIGMGETTTSSYTYKLYKIDLDRHTYSLKSTKSKVGTLTVSNDNYGTFDIMAKTIQVLIYIDRSGEDTITRYQDYSGFYLSNSLSGTATSTSMDFTGSYYDTYNKYQIAPTQLTAIADYVYEKEFYGINGVETGTLQNTEVQSKTELNIKVTLWDSYSKNLEYNGSLENAFNGNTEIETIPNIDISLVESMWGTFAGCTNLKSIPELNTINVKHFTRTFIGCTNLVTIPILPTNNVTTMSNFVSGCPNLSDETLNNILQMCINATNYTQTKSLSHLGLTVEQRSKCMTLSNYTAFTNAGWTA